MSTLTIGNMEKTEVIQFKNKDGQSVETLTEWCVKCRSKRYRGDGTDSCINFVNEAGQGCQHIWKDKQLNSTEKK